MNRLSILVPSYNDFLSLGKLCARIHSVCSTNSITYEIVFVDMRSADLTRDYILQLANYYPIKMYTTNDTNNVGEAITLGAQKASYDTLCVLPANLTYPPEAIPHMLEKMHKGADIVVGDPQTARSAMKHKYPPFLAKILTRFGVTVTSPLKMFSKHTTAWLHLSDAKQAYDYEFIYKAHKAGFRIFSHEVTIPETRIGNKMGFFEAAKEIIRATALGFFVKPLPAMVGMKGGAVVRTTPKRKIRYERKRAYNHRATKLTHVFYSLAAFACVLAFGAWWFRIENVPNNFVGSLHYIDFVLFALVSYIIWHPIMMDVLTWTIASYIKPIKKHKPVPGLSVAFITTIVPSSESLDLLHKCLPAMVTAHYKHDTWLLDEGNSPEVKAICEQYGVLYFSRKGVNEYNTPNGKFTRTKGGNHNSWYDMYGHAYDIVAQIDTDFVPKKTFLTKTLGYFRDPHVAFVGTPQVYGNTEDSIVAKGAAEQLHTFYGSVLRGLSSMRMTLLIGANHIIRSKALKEVDHYSAHITEDLITGMKLHTKGWKSVYLSEPLAIGEGPNTWESYFSQQMRWAYGCIDIFFKHSPRMFRKMGLRRAFFYFFLQQHYFSGIAMALSVVLLSLYFVAGLRAADIDIFKFFVAYSFIVLISWLLSVWLQQFNVDRKRFGELHIAGKLISIAAWPVWFLAFLCVLTGKSISYKVTPKGEGDIQVRSSLRSFYPHIVFGLISVIGIVSSFFTQNQSMGMLFWAILSAILMLSIPFVQEIADAFEKLRDIFFKGVTSLHEYYANLKRKLQPRRIFIHNTARRNIHYYPPGETLKVKTTYQESSSTKGLLFDSLFLAGVVILSAILYIQQIGFYSDDWSFIGNFSTAKDTSLWGLIQTAFTPNTLMRPVMNVYDAFLFWSFGTNPFGYQMVNTGVMIGVIVLFYHILRVLGISRIIAISIPLIYALLPNYATDRFWFAVFQANLCMLFYFFSLYAALRSMSYKTAFSSQWKFLSIVGLVLSALSYEVAVPLSLVTLIILLNPSELFSKIISGERKFMQRDIIFVFVTLATLFYIYLFKVKSTTRLHDDLTLDYIVQMFSSALHVNYGIWLLQLPHIWGQTVSLYTTQPMLIAGALLYIATFWYLLFIVTRNGVSLPSVKWMANLTLISFGIFVLGYLIFITNNQVGFSPTGIDNRVAIAASIGVAMTIVGIFGVLARLLLPERFAKVFFVMCISVMSTGGFLVINAMATFWIQAHQDGQRILADIAKSYPTMKANTTVILDGICPYVGPAPVFEAEWDLKGALQTHYKDASLRADVVTPRLKVENSGLKTQIYTFPAQYPYKNLVIYNYDTKTSHPIKNAHEANAYFQQYNPDFSNGCPVAHAGKGVPIF